MSPTTVIAVFDVGKTNKKMLLFDEQYQLVHEENRQLPETVDEDGFLCEDVIALTNWLKDSFASVVANKSFEVKAVNFSAYGASFVYLDDEHKVIAPLYNYLKPYPPDLQKKFYHQYGGESDLARQTASPVLGNLNSGLQLYRLKKEKPGIYDKIKWALHLPQYLSYVLGSAVTSDITSIGCHTKLWDYRYDRYHEWVVQEAIVEKFPDTLPCTAIAGYAAEKIPVGVGLHDSSAALIPYLACFNEPFILLSTGTWCISLNPFNHSLLTNNELNQDCLCYLTYEGKPVKASRLFAGNEHEVQTKRLASHFKQSQDYFSKVSYDTTILSRMIGRAGKSADKVGTVMVGESNFPARVLEDFANYEEAYHCLMADIVDQQVRSTKLVLKDAPVSKIFVDGGFSKNSIYMQLLAKAFPGIEVFAASVPQASALGAALAIHAHWNDKIIPRDLIELKLYVGVDDSRLKTLDK